MSLAPVPSIALISKECNLYVYLFIKNVMEIEKQANIELKSINL